MNALKQKNFFYKLNITLFTIIIVELCISGIYFLAHDKTFLNTIALATTVKPEAFTELYFDNNATLPLTIVPKQTISFTFTVHNLENKTYTYPYNVYLVGNNKEINIDKGQFTITNNGYKTITEKYTATESTMDAQMVVALPTKNQEIFFWLNKNNNDY